MSSPSPIPDAVTLDTVTPPISTPTFSLTISPSSTVHPTHSPGTPFYFLPTSLSTHSITLPINRYSPKVLSARDRSSLHANHLFVISKIPTTDTYNIVSHVPGRSGKGVVTWTAGWLWGGNWDVEFVLFDESLDKERRLRLKCAGGTDGRWFFWEESELPEGEVVGGAQATVANAAPPEEILVAEEQPRKQGEEQSDGGETILIHTGKPEVTDVVRELITVAWITRCWNERTKVGWFTSSARDRVEWAGGLKFRW
ncbi:hypothetical protein BDZ91DRAFT_369825 [Kalaharituber pfeilii]|nr:hypothetical protein BDZ91DRAFT_369825 [Kalaharituber pfeilii]